MKEKIGYAFGDLAGLLSFSLVSSFLQMYYTDVFHIPLTQITLLMIIARVWDAINDPIWGAFVDSRKPTKYGRFRPYVFWMSIPLTLASILMFVKIPGLTTTQYVIYAYVTYIFYGMMYTGVNIPYGSLASVITSNEADRASLSMWRSIGAGVGSLPVQIILPLLVYTTVEGSDEKVLDPTKFTYAVIALSVVALIIFYIHFSLVKERVELPKKQKQKKFNVLNTVKALLKNRSFIILCIVSMLLICFQMYTQTMYNYLFKNYYLKPGLYSVVTICTYLPMVMFIPFMGKLIKRFGKKELCTVGIGFAALVNLFMYFLKFTDLSLNPYIFLVLIFFSGLGQTFMLLEVWALVTDVIDYHEYKTQRREEATSYAIFSFSRKLGQAIAGAGASILLGVVGYNVNATDIGQSAEVVERLYTIATLVPAIVLAVMFLLMLFGYSLSKSRLKVLHEELDIIRANYQN